MCKMGLTSATRLLRFVTFVHLPFSVGSLGLFVAPLVFMKGTSCCVTRRNLKYSRAVDRAMANDFRCCVHAASLSLTPLLFAM